MAPSRLSDRPIQLRRDVSDEEYESNEEEDEQVAEQLDEEEESDELESGVSDPADHDPRSSETEDERTHSSDSSTDEDPDDLKDISFGALAKAQASFTPPAKSRKRKLSSLQPTSNTPLDNPHPTQATLSQKPDQDLSHRTSKHAPTILSSRHPVSRKRTILSPPPTTKSRDPRFDPAITSRTLNAQSIASASKAYSFLTDYQASEILHLKSAIKKAQTSDPAHADELKKQLMSMESRLRNVQRANKEREVLQRHKQQEKQAIKEGKKGRAYFLKKSDVRKEIERERVEGMGKRQKDKMERRKRMREKRKEARDMPWARRMG